MNGDSTRKSNGDTESRVVRLETSSQHYSEVLQDFRSETRMHFDRVYAQIQDVRTEIRSVRAEIRVFFGLLVTVAFGVAAIVAKIYGA